MRAQSEVEWKKKFPNVSQKPEHRLLTSGNIRRYQSEYEFPVANTVVTFGNARNICLHAGFTHVDANLNNQYLPLFAVLNVKHDIPRQKNRLRVAKGRKCLHGKQKTHLSINWQNIKLKGTNKGDKWGTIRRKPFSSSRKFNLSFDRKNIFCWGEFSTFVLIISGRTFFFTFLF